MQLVCCCRLYVSHYHRSAISFYLRGLVGGGVLPASSEKARREDAQRRKQNNNSENDIKCFYSESAFCLCLQKPLNGSGLYLLKNSLRLAIREGNQSESQPENISISKGL